MYVDYAATSPLRPGVRQFLQQSYAQDWGNASSLHRDGHRARMLCEDARERVAAVLGTKVEEIVFTAGATEANNLALFGWMRQQPKGSHLIVSAVEHPSVWEAADALRFEGYAVDTAPVDSQGVLDVERLQALIRPETQLVSVMAVNNEVGSLQPISTLAALPKKWKLHVDAVQSGWVGWPDLSGIDFLSISAHKLGGPIGSGCLFLRQGLRLNPILIGGSQEDHRRAGTLNPIGAAALAQALEESARLRPQQLETLRACRDRLETALQTVPAAHRLGQQRSPHISSWTFEDVNAEALLVLLDMQGISASSGSACSSHSLEPSRVVLAMGHAPEQARGLIRFSLGFDTRLEDMDRLAETVTRLVAQVRTQTARLPRTDAV